MITATAVCNQHAYSAENDVEPHLNFVISNVDISRTEETDLDKSNRVLSGSQFVYSLYCIVLYCIVMHCIVLHCIAFYCIILYCIVLYCIVLYCIVLYCIVLYCIVEFIE